MTLVQDQLLLVDSRMLSQADEQHPELGSALQHLLSSGGKRIRPVVSLLTGGMFEADMERVITLSAAIEMLHTATLVHDDLIDGSLLRRGIATINSQWSPAATVLTGDFIFARAARLAAETNSLDVMRLFSETLATIVSGEITQLFSSHSRTTRDDYYQRIYAKTASMFELATAASAMLSPVDKEVIERVKQLGYQIGMAFQIVDDILDFTGEQATVGKPVGNDLRLGLLTLPALYYLDANPGDLTMQAMLQGSRIKTSEMDTLVESIRTSDAIALSFDEANRFVDKGLAILETMPDRDERRAFEELACYIVNRQL